MWPGANVSYAPLPLSPIGKDLSASRHRVAIVLLVVTKTVNIYFINVFFLRAQPKIDTVLAKIRSLKMVNKSAFGCAQCSILNAHQKYNLANYSPSGGVLQAAVSARLQIFGFDAGRGTPQSLLVWFFEFDSISSLIAAPCEYAFIMAA